MSGEQFDYSVMPQKISTRAQYSEMCEGVLGGW